MSNARTFALGFILGLACGYSLHQRASEHDRRDLVLQGVHYGYWAQGNGTGHGAAVNALMNVWDD